MEGRERTAAIASLWDLKRGGALLDRVFLLPVGWKSARVAILLPRHQQACNAVACSSSSELPAKCYSRELAVPQPAGKVEPGSSSWMRKPRTPQKAVTKCKARGICSRFMLAGKTEEIRGVPKEMHVGNLWSTKLCLGAGGGSAGCFHKSCWWQSS